MRSLLASAAIAAAALLSSGPSSANTPRVVHIAAGDVSGTQTKQVEAFLGLPYAASPAGANRWRAPQPVVSWPGIRKATAFGPACQQELSGEFGPYTKEYLTQGEVSEDCLSLNVWRPVGVSPDARLPVMVWIHGGAFSSGASSVPIYDGAELAKRGVIVISVNYRLGVFGFLAHPELTRDGEGSGNYGLLDLIAALKWVHANIGAFGGSADQVTIAGQSAGSMAVHALITAPSAKGLFARAISQSGPGIGLQPEPIASAEKKGIALTVAAGVSSIDELRKLPAARVEQVARSLRTGLLQFAPVIDGTVLPANPYVSRKGGFSDTPVLAGMNADEAFSLPKSDIAGLDQEIDNYFGSMRMEARQLYGVSDSAKAELADRLLRRERGIASTYGWAKNRAAQSEKPIYLYLFDHVEPGSEQWGAFHTSEVPYALHTLSKAPSRKFTALDQAISDTMLTYWVNFIKTGNPNGERLTSWPAYLPAKPVMNVIGAKTGPIDPLPAAKHTFYEKFQAAGGTLALF